MSYSITHIIPVIEQEVEVYRDLLELLHQQQAFILKGQIQNLTNNISAQKELMLKAKSLEKDRRHKISSLAYQWGVIPEECTLTDLLQRVADDYSAELSQLKQNLSSLVTLIGHVNKTNRFLIGHWLRFIRKNIQILTGAESLNLGYSRSGHKATENLNKRVVDQTV